MRYSNTCPQCQGTEITRIPSSYSPFSAYRNCIPISWFRNIDVTRYLCINCGFIEEWVEGATNLDTLRNEYGLHIKPNH